jgi:2-keto-myo-inositol isomerase
MPEQLSRRELLTAAAIGTAAVGFATQSLLAAPTDDAQLFGYCLNMSTIRGQNLTATQQVEIAAKSGYNGIEPWVGDLRKYVEQGGSAADLRKQIEDSGLKVASVIGFAEWIVDDDAQRAKGLENAKRDMELTQQIGGLRLAAPPAGATKQPGLSLNRAAERYRALLEAGKQIGVTPQLELWGFSAVLSRLSELLYVAIESGHPDACLLPDVYHIYKGGSDFGSLRLLNGRSIHVLHMNDYPAKPDRQSITDADRVYPGDGVAPLTSILRDLHGIGFRGMLSLEVFNREYWKQEAIAVARIGLEKMKAAVSASFAEA